jgi:methionyl-tRNA formyltransferase
MRLCIAGKNDIAANVLMFALKNAGGFRDIVVVPNAKENTGWQKSLREEAKKNNIAEISLEEAYPVKDLVFLSLEYDKIIHPERFLSPCLFNVHFSLLPKYKGMYTSAWPLLNGESETGVTLHVIDAGIDTGAIIDQIAFPIDENDNASDLYRKYMQFGEKCVTKNIANLRKGCFETRPQSPEHSTYYSKNSIDYNNLRIDFNQTAFMVRNQIRAYTFPEYQHPQWSRQNILSCLILGERSKSRAGTLVWQDRRSVRFATIDYDILLNIQDGCPPSQNSSRRI